MTFVKSSATKTKKKMSIIRFIKNWTLPVAIATGSLLYLIFAFVPALDAAGEFFDPIMATLLPAFMFFTLFVVFCKVDFRKLRPVRWHLWLSLFQMVTVMVLTWLVVEFSLTGKSLVLVEAMLVCVIGPCASAAPVVTQKLGGNLEQMTTYTFLSNFITALFVPLCFPLIDKAADVSFLTAFGIILYKVATVLVAPMALAWAVKHLMPRLHRWIVGVKDLSYYSWAMSLLIVSGTTIRNIVHADTSVLFLCIIALMGLLLCIMQFGAGRFIGHYFGASVNAGQGLGQKNTAFAIWIASAYLNPLSTVGPGCYILWQNIINSVEIWMCRREGKDYAA